MIAGLQKSDTRADIFTFLQSVSNPTPKYSYRFEYDNFAVLPVSTFEHWWDQSNTLISHVIARDRLRSAELCFVKCRSATLLFKVFAKFTMRRQYAKGGRFVIME